MFFKNLQPSHISPTHLCLAQYLGLKEPCKQKKKQLFKPLMDNPSFHRTLNCTVKRDPLGFQALTYILYRLYVCISAVSEYIRNIRKKMPQTITITNSHKYLLPFLLQTKAEIYHLSPCFIPSKLVCLTDRARAYKISFSRQKSKQLHISLTSPCIKMFQVCIL